MSARSTPARTGVQVQPAGKPDKALRRLRQLCIALAVVCAAALPFELGVLRIPPLTAGARATPHPTLATPHPTLRILSVNNLPRTAVVGRTEQFPVRLSGVSHTWLTYMLRYPDGREDHARVRAYAGGSSSHTFREIGYRPRHFRETAAIGVRDRCRR